VKFDEVSLAAAVLGQCVGVDAEPLHHAVRSWNSTVRHGPHEHVRRFRVQELKVPEIVVRGLSLWDFFIRLRLCKYQLSPPRVEMVGTHSQHE
jgi:hypothetical protein